MTYQFSNKIASLKPSAIREILKAPKDADTISLAAGNPAPETFPVTELAKFAADIFANDSTTALQYGATDGYEPLRRAVADRQKSVWGIGKAIADGDSFNDTTIIVSGGNQGIELCAKVFCNEGDTVICENPTFIGGLNAFRSCGYNTVGVPIEEDGMNVAALEETIRATPNAKLLYIIPTFQNPAGITTSLEKRKAIYEVCKKHGLMILEDNPYGELRFAGEEIPTIKSFDTEGLVIYCSSFSKILSAGMRVGFVVAPEEVAAKMVVAKQSEDVHTNQFFQMLCYKFMTECDLDAHIAMIREVYGRKCRLMLECLEQELPSSVSFTRPEGGLFIWVTLPDGVDATAFLKACMAEKLMIVPGATFNCDVSESSMSFRLNYSTPSDQQIREGVARLGRVAREFVK